MSGCVERAGKPAGTRQREMFRPYNCWPRPRTMLDGVAIRDGYCSSRQPYEDIPGLCGGDTLDCLPRPPGNGLLMLI
jgi:hypothetical protein